jgi:hypothetical protein
MYVCVEVSGNRSMESSLRIYRKSKDNILSTRFLDNNNWTVYWKSALLLIKLLWNYITLTEKVAQYTQSNCFD